MGMSPRQVDDTTLWEFQSSVTGWMSANSVEQKADSLNEDEHDRLMEKYA